ncbi:hypothetical protein SGRA_3484 [Saprospira grandis str. Lewin]|uniref:Uncharacterized protein n=1 Tax=Saprospira grandis (strain Lewin) TaxID=984262 RepID=H6L044_SAPGL|nr:hypothetical protein SGRA_3484 [Saprospira grandis str. Lewin]
MAGGGRRPDQAFLSKAKKSDGPSEQRAPRTARPAQRAGQPLKKNNKIVTLL